jgi:arginine/ornithine transport system substrate-binding protein
VRKIATLILAAAGLALAAVSAAADGMTVRIATEGAYPPFNFVDKDGKLQGFDVDIANALCEHMNAKCTIVAQDWDGIIPGLLAKKYDAIIASMSITDERRKKVLFTDKYYKTPARFVAKKGANIEITAAGLKGKRVGVQRATIHENFVRAKFPDAEVVVYDTTDNANADLAAGRLDLRVDNGAALEIGFLKTDAGKDFAFVGPGFFEPSEILGYGAGIAVRKEDTALRDAFNAALKEMRADGTYKLINDKYFSFDVFGPAPGS